MESNCLEPPVIGNSFGKNGEFFNAFQAEIGTDRAYKICSVRIIQVGRILLAKSYVFTSRNVGLQMLSQDSMLFEFGILPKWTCRKIRNFSPLLLHYKHQILTYRW